MDERNQSKVLMIAKQSPDDLADIRVALFQTSKASRGELGLIAGVVDERRDELDKDKIESFDKGEPVVWEDGGEKVMGTVVGYNKRTVKVLSDELMREQEYDETTNIAPDDLRSALKDTDEQDEAADDTDDADDREESPEITAQQLTEE